MKHRGATEKASRYFGVRLNAKDQEHLEAILAAGLADTLSDAIRCGLEQGARLARRILRSAQR